MAHIGEETVLRPAEHLDLFMLPVGRHDLFMQAVLRIEHDDSHDQLEDKEQKEIHEGFLRRDMFLTVSDIHQDRHGHIRNADQADILKRINIDTYRYHQGYRQIQRRIHKSVKVHVYKSQRDAKNIHHGAKEKTHEVHDPVPGIDIFGSITHQHKPDASRKKEQKIHEPVIDHTVIKCGRLHKRPDKECQHEHHGKSNHRPRRPDHAFIDRLYDFLIVGRRLKNVSEYSFHSSIPPSSSCGMNSRISSSSFSSGSSIFASSFGLSSANTEAIPLATRLYSPIMG